MTLSEEAAYWQGVVRSLVRGSELTHQGVDDLVNFLERARLAFTSQDEAEEA